MKRKLAALVTLLLCASAFGQTAANNPTATNESTLDSVRRELKELPAAERSGDLLGKHPGLGSAALPTLNLPGESGSSAATRPGPNDPPSANWLQDALTKTNAELASHRRATDTPSNHERLSGSKLGATPNPFAQYLDQWMSPRDLDLLRAGQETKTPNEPTVTAAKPWDSESARSPTYSTANPAKNQDSPLIQPGSDSALIQIMPVARNPYIDEPENTPTAPPQTPMLPQVASGQPQQTDRTRAPLPLSSAPVASPVTPRQPSTPLPPAVAPVAPAQRPPTAPIVDDRKYFPQLRRF